MSSASPLSPTFYGHIASTQDALILFEACLNGTITHVARRPHDRERASLIKSGNVFIYEEHSSGIKRWTDGVPWSPSRILGNFLVYRELERPFPPGEKKRAMKRSKRSPGVSKSDPYAGQSSSIPPGYGAASASISAFDDQNGNHLSKETERSLIGSLVDSYGFKEDGLVKKTVSVTVGTVSHHLVSYYTVADVMNTKFVTPSKDPRLQHITPRADLVTKQNFRTPIDEVENLDRIDDRAAFSSYQFSRNPYEVTNQTITQRPASIPTPSATYGPSPTVYTSYGINSTSGSYDSLAPHTQTGPFGNQFAPAPNVYQAQKPEAYDMGNYRPHRYNSVTGIIPDPSRSQIPPTTTHFPRRVSNFEPGSVDARIVALPNPAPESKLASDQGYAPQGYYTNPRDTHGTSTHNFGIQRPLPAPSQQVAYDRPQANSYTPEGNASAKEGLWPMANAGHGHYVNSHQPWTDTGTS